MAALLPCGGNDLADDVRHDLGVVDLDVVAADEGDVPGAGHQPGQGILRDIPGTVVDVAEVLRDEGRQRAVRDRGRDDRSEVTGTGAGVTGHDRDGQPAGQRPSGAAWATLASKLSRSMAGYLAICPADGPVMAFRIRHCPGVSAVCHCGANASTNTRPATWAGYSPA